MPRLEPTVDAWFRGLPLLTPERLACELRARAVEATMRDEHVEALADAASHGWGGLPEDIRDDACELLRALVDGALTALDGCG